MPATLRVRCSCGEVLNTTPGSYCPNCRQLLNIPTDAVIYLYRKGSPLGIADKFGIYIDGQPMGYIGNKETLCIPVTYGRCNALQFHLTPQSRQVYAKVWMRPGFWSNSFVLEFARPDEMPL